MKISNISNNKFYLSNNSCNFKGASLNSEFPKEIVIQNPNKTKTILKNLNFKDSSNYEAGYLKVEGADNSLVMDIRFDKRYNEIRAIEYKDNIGGFNYIKNSLSVSLDKDKKIRRVYLINKDGDNVTHTSLDKAHGFTTVSFDKDNNKSYLRDKNLNIQINFFIKYTKNMLSVAQSNNLTNSESILDKFSDFCKNII